MFRSELWYEINESIDKALSGETLSLREVEQIYTLDADSPEAFLVRCAGNRRARELSGGVAEIHAQIGLDAGLPLSFCIEPIGEEHTARDFLDRLALHLQFKPLTGGVGRRIPVKGTKVEHCRKFTQQEQALLIGLYRLLDSRTVLVGSANATLAADTGANLCWAECSCNPRDFSGHTELDGVGRSVEYIAKIYAETGWELRKGYSPGWNMA